jgi:hypothetical protein
MDIAFWIFFLFWIYLIRFRFNLIIFWKILTNIEELEHMEYICDKLIPVIKFENFHIYFKTRVVVEFLGDLFFMVYDIDIYQLNLRTFRNWIFFDEIPFKICVFCICLAINALIYIYFKNTITICIKEKETLIYRWALHQFFKFILFGNVSCPMVVEKIK